MSSFAARNIQVLWLFGLMTFLAAQIEDDDTAQSPGQLPAAITNFGAQGSGEAKQVGLPLALSSCMHGRAAPSSAP